jgi:Phosphotransferase enzyme family
LHWLGGQPCVRVDALRLQAFDRLADLVVTAGSSGGRSVGRQGQIDPAVAEWCLQWLGATPLHLLFEGGHLSGVVGLDLSDGRQVVVKIRPPAARIVGCVAVQRHLFAAGFPCPEPLAGPAPIGSATATAETYIPGGDVLDVDAAAPALFAKLLVDLVRLAPPAATIPTLEPAPPWVGWNHDATGTWPRPDDLDVDLNAKPGPPWIDKIGRSLRERLLKVAGEVQIGHLDWESHNIRWNGQKPVAVHDWDSVAALSEPAIAGTAATVFTSSPDGRTVAASIQQTEAFLDAYQAMRGARWNREEEEACWAAGMWVLTYNAKKETLGGGGGYLKHLEREASERMRRAGI